MPHSSIDRSSQNGLSQGYESNQPQRKIDPVAQLKALNDNRVRDWGLFEDPTAQLFARDEEEKTQAKIGDEEQQQKAAPGSTGTATHLPSHVQAKMGSSFGTDFSGVNIHTNSDQATSMGALAYTQGNDVHFAPGQYNPGSQKGQELIGHELTHVVQQRQGRVAPTKQGKGLPVNDNPALEKEADEMGAKAAQGKMVSVNNSVRNEQIQKKRALPSGVERIEIDAERVIGAFESAWQNRPKEFNSKSLFDTPKNFNDHPDLPSLIRAVCGGRYFYGTNYWNSGWIDDGDNDILWAGDSDVFAEMKIYIDNEQPHSSGTISNTSTGEYSTSDQRSNSTTYSAEGSLGVEKSGVNAGLKGGVSNAEGRVKTDDSKGSLTTTSNLAAKYITGDIFVQVSLKFRPSIWDPVIGVSKETTVTVLAGRALISSVF